MVGYEQAITEKNVIEYKCIADMDMMNEAFQDFAQTIEDAGYTPVKSIFYANGGEIDQTENVPLQIFVPVAEDYHGKLPENFIYRSYFQIRHLLSVRVKGMTNLDFARGLEKLGQAVLETGDLEDPNTPTFFVFHELKGEVYTDISVGLQRRLEDKE